MANRIEMHGQIKAFYSIVFNNTHDIRTTHVSLYIFLLNQNNRNNWVEWFKCPYDLAMQGACISSRTTYYSILHDLSDFNLIEYKKGINNFKAPMIKIIPLTLPKFEQLTEQLTEQVTVPLSEQQTVPLSVPQTVPLSGNILRLITDNLKPITDNYAIFEKFVLDLSKPNITYNEFIDKFNLLRKSKFSNKDNKAKGQFNARIKEGKTIDDILTALQNAMKEKNHIESGFKYLTPEFITRSDKLEMFLNSGNTETEKQTQPPPKEPDGFRDRVDHNEMIQEDWDYVNLIKKLYNKRIV